ncbi:hypothetical protein EDB80DRAFT_756432 [Ilyonectria destructans]|nr:hypothetical protein EDB80DRAFT_756432 [Ilyonectria destructans]
MVDQIRSGKLDALPCRRALNKLPGVIEETAEILTSTRSYIHTTVLTHPSADQVLEVLKTCHIAHFTCHRLSDYLDPSNSVQRVSELWLRCAQIAYLSGCSTAENKAARLLDKVIHIVSGFLPAGDSEYVDVAKRFYSLVLQGNQSAINNNEVASALQDAVMAVRAEDLSMPLNWAQFVHYGV